MAKHLPQVRPVWVELSAVISAVGLHLFYLLRTTFVDWPEMLMYPWFASHGLVYYRDVSVPFPPLINYFLSCMYGVFGYSPVSERIIAYICIVFTDVLLYLTVRFLLKNRIAALGSLLFFIIWQPVFYGNALWHETVIAPIMLVALLCSVSYMRSPGRKSAVFLGVVITTLSLMKQTVIWPITAVSVFLLITSRNRLRTVGHLCVFAVMVVTAHLGIYLYYSYLGAGSDYLFWVYRFPLSLTGVRTLYQIMPSRSDIAMLLPAFFPLFALPMLSKDRKLLWLLIVCTAALILMSLPRWGIFRLQPALTFASVGFGAFLIILSKRLFRWQAVLWSIVIVATFIFGWRSFRVFITLRDPMQPQFFGRAYTELLDFTEAHLIGPMYILGNYDYLYLGRNEAPMVRPWLPMFPWNGQIPGAQERIIRSLEQTRVPNILYIPFHGLTGFYGTYEPVVLMTYIRSRYYPVSDLPIEGGVLYRRRPL